VARSRLKDPCMDHVENPCIGDIWKHIRQCTYYTRYTTCLQACIYSTCRIACESSTMFHSMKGNTIQNERIQDPFIDIRRIKPFILSSKTPRPLMAVWSRSKRNVGEVKRSSVHASYLGLVVYITLTPSSPVLTTLPTTILISY